MEENEDVIVREFTKEFTLENIDDIVCVQSAQYCDDKDTANTDDVRDEL